MFSFKFSITLVFLSFLSFISCTSEAAPNFLYNVCDNTTSFIKNSTYNTNLDHLLSSLSSNGTRNDGFYNTAAGQSPDIVYGLFLCRGDVSTEICKECITFATTAVLQLCPYEKIATVYYDECSLCYSNESISFNRNEHPAPILMQSAENISSTQQSRFNQLVASLMNDAVTEALNASASAKKFATKKANFTQFQTLYSLVQCTDLSTLDCNTCLRQLIGDLPMCCSGSQGARLLSPSCNIRYEVFPFYNETKIAAPVLLPPLRGPKGKSHNSSLTIIAIVAPVAISVMLFFLGYCFLSRRARKRYHNNQEENGISNIESLQFDLATIEAATNKFSHEKKLGEGGFGEVYKGTLPNGQEIAVKRLSRSSGQGAKEFKNEVALVAKLQHRNLARLFGFCLEGKEKILIYEFVPNRSLDNFLYDPEKQRHLDWSTRYKIIGGIARGILYLHEDSRLRIIHRDLKSSNILLDGNMNPKISDFGMARIFGVDQTQGNTSRIVGTYGYISPEYAMRGQFSVKSDVYSFGVLVLEIISGKKNSISYQSDGAVDLLSYAWKHWRDGTPLELLNPHMKNCYSRYEVLRCIHIGLLCVQEDAAKRPTMSTIVLMLNSYSVTLPLPQQPAFFLQSGKDISIPAKGLESDQSTANSLPCSVNEASISEVYPR